MKLVVFVILAVCVTGCGTFRTTGLDEPRIEIGTKTKKSLCTQIPHVYSGVFHNFCWMHREANPNYSSIRTTGDLPLIVVDTVLSGMMDTILLPYSIYQQAELGSIKVDR